MPLTRHFYASEEVLASLLYTTSKGVVKESVFWCHELIHSGYTAEAISILFESWVWHYGVFSMGWFIQTWKRLGQEEISSDDLLEEVYRLCHQPIRDHSVWNILARQYIHPSEGHDSVTFRSPPQFPSADPTEVYFIRAIHQHKTGAAWWMAQWISEDRFLFLIEWYRDTVITESQREGLMDFFEAIRSYDTLLGYAHEGYHLVSRLLQLMSVCLTNSQRERSFRTGRVETASCAPLEGWLTKWSEVMGRKAGRVYSIPYYGLYGTWGRGRMVQTRDTMGELVDIEKGVRDCPFWQEAWEEKGWEEREAYFPDDLPDEWARSEKEKSHGSGLLRPNEKVTLWGYAKRYMMGRSYLAWNRGEWKQQSRIDFFDGLEIDPADSPFQTLLVGVMEQKEKKGDLPSDLLLTPKHKRFRVVY